MGSIRLRIDQVERMRQSEAGPGAVILSAIQRFEAGEIKVMQNAGKNKKTTNCITKNKRLVSFSTRNEKILSYSGKKLRAILDAHFNSPLFCAEIAQEDRIIESFFQSVKGVPYTIRAAE